MPCVGCGYDVRGLDADGACPECGTPIRRSLAGDQLVNADPAWVKRIVLGQRLVAYGLVLTVLGFTASLFTMFLSRFVTSWLEFDWEGVGGELLRAITLFVGVGGGLLIACVGFFLVTSLDPRETDRELPTSKRLLARWGMFAGVILLVVGEADMFNVSRVLSDVALGCSLLGLVAMAIAIPSLYAWLSGLAARIPHDEGASSTAALGRTLRWQLWTLVALAIIHHATDLVPVGTAAHRYARWVETTAGCSMAVIVLLLLFSLLATFATMAMLAGAFGELLKSETTRS